jgi:hypothetical protein
MRDHLMSYETFYPKTHITLVSPWELAALVIWLDLAQESHSITLVYCDYILLPNTKDRVLNLYLSLIFLFFIKLVILNLLRWREERIKCTLTVLRVESSHLNQTKLLIHKRSKEESTISSVSNLLVSMWP